MLNYDNNNCLGNALTYNKPCSFSARITNNNNIDVRYIDNNNQLKEK